MFSGLELPLGTYGDKYGPAMKITKQAKADAYFEVLVQQAMSFGLSHEKAESNEQNNLAYYAGYYNAKTRARVEKLFHCAHPVLGAIAEEGSPTPEEAFRAGQEHAKGNFTYHPPQE